MKAAIYLRKNSRKELEITETAIPTPKDDEVLIRVHAASVNPLDWRLKSRHPGVDVAGEVRSVGENVTRFKAGDAVFGLGKATFSEYARAPESSLAVKPANLTFEQAAATPIAGLTALQGLRDIGRLRAGEEVLINGAAGGVGTFAVQIAKALGGHVTGVCSTRNVQQSLQLGAEQVLDYAKTDVTEDGRRYDLVLDNVGNIPLSAFRRVLKPRSRCVMVGAPKSMGAVFVRIAQGFAWSPFLSQKFIFFIARAKSADLETLGDLFRSGRVAPIVDRVYPLAEAAEAIRYVEDGHARAKVVLQIGC